MKLEAPPGFEPGMEVLQTSALPLGDGAGRNRLCEGVPAAGQRRLQQRGSASLNIIIHRSTKPRDPASKHERPERSWRRSASVVQAARRGAGVPADQIMERETGFEPATSTLARSHSTTELFPLAQKL